MKSFLKDIFSDWHVWEIWYTFICAGVIAGISLYLDDSPAGVISAVAGTLYTMFAGKGKVICYFFGIINTLLYGYIAASYTLYGDMMLNWLVYLPMMFAGIILWKRKLDASGSVIKTSLAWRGRAVLISGSLAGICIYALILFRMGDKQPITDAATTVFSVAAMIMTLKRCIEQWVLWTLVNGLSVIMWVRVYISGGNSSATLLWWLIMLVTGIIFFIQWYRSIKISDISKMGS